MGLLSPADKTTLKVSGMTCGNCVQHVQQALESVSGVKKAVADLDTGQATVTHKGADTAAMVAAVQEAGYDATTG